MCYQHPNKLIFLKCNCEALENSGPPTLRKLQSNKPTKQIGLWAQVQSEMETFIVLDMLLIIPRGDYTPRAVQTNVIRFNDVSSPQLP